MAVNPAVIKAAAKAALSIITDEREREKLAVAVIAPAAAAVLLTTMIVYAATMPFAWLTDFFSGEQLEDVKNFRIEHGYDQLIGAEDAEYIESAGKEAAFSRGFKREKTPCVDFSGVTFTGGMTDVVYYNQLDARRKDLPYGVTGTIGNSGCGPTSLAIVVSSLTGRAVNPVEMADWAYQNGYVCEGSGSYHSLIPEGARYYSLAVEGCGVNEPQRIIDALASGKLVAAIMGKGAFTKSGHFLVMRGVTPDGKILVADPASQSRSEKEWDLEIFLNEARKGAAAGGPFWICSL